MTQYFPKLPNILNFSIRAEYLGAKAPLGPLDVKVKVKVKAKKFEIA